MDDQGCLRCSNLQQQQASLPQDDEADSTGDANSEVILVKWELCCIIAFNDSTRSRGSGANPWGVNLFAVTGACAQGEETVAAEDGVKRFGHVSVQRKLDQRSEIVSEQVRGRA